MTPDQWALLFTLSSTIVAVSVLSAISAVLLARTKTRDTSKQLDPFCNARTLTPEEIAGRYASA